MKVKQSRKKCHMSTSDILATSSLDMEEGTGGSGKKPRERRSLGGKVEKKKQGNRKWSLLDIFGLGSTKKNKTQGESKGKKKHVKEAPECEISKSCTLGEGDGGYSTKQAGHTPKQGQKLRLSSSKFIDLVKMKENVPSKTSEPKLSARKMGRRTPLMDLVRGGNSGAKVMDSNMLNKDKQKYTEKASQENSFSVLNEANCPKVKVNSPEIYKDDQRRGKSSSKGDLLKTPEQAVKSNKLNQSDIGNSSNARVGLAKCLVNEAQGHKLKQTPQKKALLSTPDPEGRGRPAERTGSCKYSLRSAGSTPPKPPGPRRKTVSKRNLQDINAKLAESAPPTGNIDGITARSASRKPPIRKPPRRSLPKRETVPGMNDYANLSSISLEILAKPKELQRDDMAISPDMSRRKRGSYKASQESPIHWSDVHGTSMCTVSSDVSESVPAKRRRNNSLSESCNSPVMPSNHSKNNKTKDDSYDMSTPPSKKRRSVSLSRGRSHSLSRSRSLSSSRLRRNNPPQRVVNDYVGSTPRIKKRNLVTRSRSMATTRPSELATLKPQTKSPLLTPFTAVMKEMEEAKTGGRRRKKEKTLADVMRKQLSGALQGSSINNTSTTEREQTKKKLTPQKPPRKKLSLKSSKLDIQDAAPLVETRRSGRQSASGESEGGSGNGTSSSSEESKCMKKPPPSGSKPTLRKKPSFISDGVTKVRRKFSRPGDVKKIIDSLKLHDTEAQPVNAMNAGHTPRPPRRPRESSERVIL